MPLRRRATLASGLVAVTSGWLPSGPPLAAAFSTRCLPSSFANAELQVATTAAPRTSCSPRAMLSSASSSSGLDAPSPAKTWSDVLSNLAPHSKYATHLFPPLTSTSHKGSHGRIAILGGSDKYTGAPYYAARSALHCGVDLATVFTAEEAAVPIKCYSPELMVQSVYSVAELDGLLKEEEALLAKLEECKQSNDVLTNEVSEVELMQTMEKLEHSEEKQRLLIQSELKNDDKMEVLVGRLEKMKGLEEELRELRERQDASLKSTVDAVTSMFPTLHTLCIGPGLGRHPLVFSAVETVMQKAIESNLTMVLDADALYMLSLREYRSLLEELMDYDRCIMTPNVMEKRRLNGSLSDGSDANGARSPREHRCIIVQKGHADAIMQGSHTMQCEEEGGLKRSGGIGDVLAGTISAFMAWNAILERVHELQQQRAFAAWTSCCAVKRATRSAYQKKRRAMSAIDVMEGIGEVLETMESGLELELRRHTHQATCEKQEL